MTYYDICTYVYKQNFKKSMKKCYAKHTDQLYFKIRFLKHDLHSGGNWLIHDTTHHKDNQL